MLFTERDSWQRKCVVTDTTITYRRWTLSTAGAVAEAKSCLIGSPARHRQELTMKITSVDGNYIQWTERPSRAVADSRFTALVQFASLINAAAVKKHGGS